ncbi:MAG: TIGR02270 family protein [Candidatus Thiothrix singaporensis]|uniref:TIGR02270 family protein n=1 Tax=Candidatus Thiothrix singaporensis TaxID=2799669 RepID=A0A7L6AWH8_9GAMM|nr:MAG: TIGR02270 family protein [Candidatus Thiothrix singaporensis]
MKPVTPVIPHIIDQHAEEAAFLWLLRDNAVTEAHYNLAHLQALENRLDAHLDGLRVAGAEGWRRCLDNLQQCKEPGEMFAAATLVFEGADPDRLHALYALCEAAPETERGLISALGWVEPQHLKGKVSGLLASGNPWWRRIGVAACAIHRVDPGKPLEAAVQDGDIALCRRALQAAGELGRSDLRDLIARQLKADDPGVRFWAAWALALLGNRHEALQTLQAFLLEPGGAYTFQAAQVLARASHGDSVQYLLGILAKQYGNLRLAIQGSGMSGEARYLPWLIQQMQIPALARVAGEAFSLITGVDLAYGDLETDQPENFQAGPTESPLDDTVALDADENLPWPDPALIQAWWRRHEGEFPAGQRYLMGQPLSPQQCNAVLKTGMQRQRQAAALELALMAPQTPLFATCAKASRQRRLLTA